ncbi:MAG: ribonuclease PH [Alphaproteobacteria bacterium]|uniref:Ribonuclease PH n=1 Tax=PS1 clade bacterium TaxID=2175152 RepID=A0A368DRP3_9PROT|nr:ribonuclease PH [Rhodobiaceae bacterium]OUT74971.1 MAG: ribonuclease PH [Rhizobiales bacterium TMED25]RCL74324.1 MAG: ribonuclease PH [PS1 clade bacterium]|tara:strand:+ start:3473 stop:4192 length:720 start_codon:yes stop_codon:yes gene_type:complete
MRSYKRGNTDIRPLNIETNIIKNADGSCIVEIGETKVICTASIDDRTPPWLRGSGKGWLTAEYGMLPRSTNERMLREAKSGKQSGRTQEIQRLIGRSLRASLDLNQMNEKQILIDCDVIQADGGTRTASITGGWVALNLCIQKMMRIGLIKRNPLQSQIAAISCGILDNEVIIDLDYDEDSSADVDANLVFTNNFNLIEIQSSAEQKVFSAEELMKMISMAKDVSNQIFKIQKDAISIK